MIKISNILEVEKYIDSMKAVIFDLDDTLYSEKEYVRSGYKEVAKIIPQIANVEERLWMFFEKGKSAIDELLKLEGLEELKQPCLEAYRYQTPDICLYDGVEDLLKKLKRDGYLIGIITDGRPEGQHAKLKALGLERMTDAMIITDELGGIVYRKPNPMAFKKMKDTLGVNYSEMCYVGDNIKKDFIAPQMLGMKCIHYLNQDGIYYQ